jgi:hypothetical protein
MQILEVKLKCNYLFPPSTTTHCHFASMNCQPYCPTLSNYHFVQKTPILLVKCINSDGQPITCAPHAFFKFFIPLLPIVGLLVHEGKMTMRCSLLGKSDNALSLMRENVGYKISRWHVGCT